MALPDLGPDLGPDSRNAPPRIRAFDQQRAEAAVRDLLYAVGEDPDREGLQDTPARVARAYRDMFAGRYTEPETVSSTIFDEAHDEVVIGKELPRYSTCGLPLV